MTLIRQLSPRTVRITFDTCEDSKGKQSLEVSSSDQKHVRFSSMEDSSYPATYEICDDIMKDIWWTREEQEKINTERRELVNQVGSNGAVALHTYLYGSQLSLELAVQSEVVKKFLDDVSTTDGLRGLEGKLSKATSLHRKKHMSSVLTLGRQLKGGAGGRLISMKSAQSSRRAQVVARVLADIDEKEAR